MVHPVVRVEDAGLGGDAQVRLTLSRITDPDRLVRAWATSGSVIHREGERIRATGTPEALSRAAGRALGPGAGHAMADLLTATVAAWAGPTPDMTLPGEVVLRGDQGTTVMGILNVTPDSFSDGGVLYPGDHPMPAIAAGRRMVTEGAGLLDVGGESTRPGSLPVEESEELDRVVPVVEGLADADVPISIDTTKAAVAQACLRAGATIVNDVSGGRDRDLLEVVAEHRAGYVLMHSRGTPETMSGLTDYDDVVAEVYEYLADGVAGCVAQGIAEERIIIDPGIGFAKTAAQSLRLLGAVRQLRSLGRPVLIGASRKSFLRGLGAGGPSGPRLAGSIAAAVVAARQGAAIVRVHDVVETVQAVRVADAVREQERPPG